VMKKTRGTIAFSNDVFQVFWMEEISKHCLGPFTDSPTVWTLLLSNDVDELLVDGKLSDIVDVILDIADIRNFFIPNDAWINFAE